jgi:hypothetical protein
MHLFDEWAARFSRGDRPDLREYLTRAGDGSEELAALADAWLARMEPPEPDEDAVALAQAWINGEPPILKLRRRRGLKRDEVVDYLIERFGLDTRKRDKIKRYYHDVERGELVPADEKLVALLAEVLRARVSDLFGIRQRPLEVSPAAAFYRGATAPSTKVEAPIQAEQDEIDHLFRPR